MPSDIVQRYAQGLAKSFMGPVEGDHAFADIGTTTAQSAGVDRHRSHSAMTLRIVGGAATLTVTVHCLCPSPATPAWDPDWWQSGPSPSAVQAADGASSPLRLAGRVRIGLPGRLRLASAPRRGSS
ncbi:hypothetical protein [Streptomyces mirabilis]